MERLIMMEKVFIAIALFFTLSAAIGVWRLPDFYTRMHAASKVSSFGVGFLLVAVSIHFWGDWAALTKSILIFVFIVITNPISAHLLMRAAYHLKTPQTATSSCDEYVIAARGVIQENK